MIGKIIYDEIVGFLGISPLIDLFKSGNYSSLTTLDGILGVLGPLIPLLLLIELIRALFQRKSLHAGYRVNFIIFVFNRAISRFISVAMVAVCVGLFEKHALMRTRITWYWLIYGYTVWELSHFVYHYYAHKVRLFWCLHSTHHAPETMNLSVSYAHFFLEAPYADIIRTTICILLGVSPPLLFFIMFIDGVWGAFIHVGEGLLKDGRLGILNKWVLTPSHHRVHHAKNPLYMDTNFCNLLNIWDRVFGTLMPENSEIRPVYGITREMKRGSFLDAYFGEFVALGRDIRKAPGLGNKFLYIIMPPGWSHTGDHKTAKVAREKFLQAESAERVGRLTRA
jgi:sterol desaturase/sphingolipid hydroxylase (fatty acid hydroxylase superfamily)